MIQRRIARVDAGAWTSTSSVFGTEVTGPEHAPVYMVESSVSICDDPAMELKKIVCRGDGSSIKCAEQSAAKFLWRNYVFRF